MVTSSLSSPYFFKVDTHLLLVVAPSHIPHTTPTNQLHKTEERKKVLNCLLPRWGADQAAGVPGVVAEVGPLPHPAPSVEHQWGEHTNNTITVMYTNISNTSTITITIHHHQCRQTQMKTNPSCPVLTLKSLKNVLPAPPSHNPTQISHLKVPRHVEQASRRAINGRKV